jgi:hypothetical protein
MIWHFPALRGGRKTKLVAGVGAALFASLSFAPVVGAAAPPAVRTWTVEASPNPPGASASTLAAVSCSGPDTCIAVGSDSYPSGQQIPKQEALVEQASNGAWRVVNTPTIAGTSSSELSDVSCPAAVFCAAVGSVQVTRSPATTRLLAETWDGTSWSATLLPTPAGGSVPALAAISCATSDVCVAVGNYIDNKTDTYRPLTEQMEGSTWSVVPTPVPPIGGHTISNSRFTDIDCPTPAQCEVVGDVTYNDTLQKVFAYGFGGSVWAYQSQVNPGPDPGSTDDAVSCSSTDACTSVGTVSIIGETTLVEYWDGSTWVRQVTPTPVHRPEGALFDVSCNGGTFCVAVGESYRVDQMNGHLIDGRVMGEVWNGTAWSQVPPVVPNGLNATLTGISCPSPTACVAVGNASTTSSASTLVETYAG